jgi:hypothetical protein
MEYEARRTRQEGGRYGVGRQRKGETGHQKLALIIQKKNRTMNLNPYWEKIIEYFEEEGFAP